jgi:hypothetical protein
MAKPWCKKQLPRRAVWLVEVQLSLDGLQFFKDFFYGHDYLLIKWMAYATSPPEAE